MPEDNIDGTREETPELSLDDLDEVAGGSGGMKIEPIKSPKYLAPILQTMLKVKREQQ
jgi:hypothetical protein